MECVQLSVHTRVFPVVCYDKRFVDAFNRAFGSRVAVVAIAVRICPTSGASIRQPDASIGLPCTCLMQCLLCNVAVNVLAMATRQIPWVTRLRVAFGHLFDALVACASLGAYSMIASSYHVAVAAVCRRAKHAARTC